MPKPKATKIVCDTCGLDWSLHKKSNTDSAPLSECVRLLKAELAKPRTQPYIYAQTTAGWPSIGPNTAGTLQ